MTRPVPATVLDCYEAGLRSARHGAAHDWRLRYDDGSLAPLPLADWCGRSRPGDAGLLDQCTGATLDIGCGPGRITEALARRGVPTLGVDVAAEAVKQCRDRGAIALRRDVFGRIPGEGRWQHVVLADGNLGIGGEPRRLLERARDLLASGGNMICETLPPGTPMHRRMLRLERGDRRSDWFPWAQAGADAVAALAPAVGLVETRTWAEEGRWFVALHRAHR